MKVTIKDKTLRIANHRSLSISIDKGEYDILFRSSIRRSKMHIIMDCDRDLTIGWSRFWGTIRVKETATHAELL